MRKLLIVLVLALSIAIGVIAQEAPQEACCPSREGTLEGLPER